MSLSSLVQLGRRRDLDQALLRVAREALTAYLRGHEQYEARVLEPPSVPGLFVTIRTLAGELRGCIGHVEGLRGPLADDIAALAVCAATRDPRFPPMRREDLEQVRLELSLLSEPQRITAIDELDPRSYGVIVSCGSRRGVLLPDIPGIEHSRQQVSIAADKAGIGLDEPYVVQRFEARKISEVDS